MTSLRTPELLRTTPQTDLLAAAWLAGYSSPKTRRTDQAMIRSWFDGRALCALEPHLARRAHVDPCEEPTTIGAYPPAPTRRLGAPPGPP